MKLSKQLFIAALVLIGLACPYYIEHNPTLAIETGRKFADTVFVKLDFSFGLQFTTPRRTNEFTEVNFIQLVEKMHPDNDYPTGVTPIGYEFVPGNRLANVYLEGTDGTRKSFYCIELEGDGRSGYFVTGMYRRFDMFEVSGLYKPV